MMTHSLWTWILAGALVSSVGLNVVQWNTTCPTPDASVVESLDLTPVQVESLLACCENCGWNDDDLSKRVAVGEAELATLLSQREVDESAVTAQATKLAALRRQMFDRCVQTIVSVRGVLTESQCATLGSCCCPN